MTTQELRYRRLKLIFQLRELFSPCGFRDLWADLRAVRETARRQSTYASELRLYTMTLLLGLWTALPFQSLSSLRFFAHLLPEMLWSLGMLCIALFGFLQMLRTHDDDGSNERGRARALLLVCVAYVFILVLQILTEWHRPSTPLFAFIAWKAASVYLKLSKET